MKNNLVKIFLNILILFVLIGCNTNNNSNNSTSNNKITSSSTLSSSSQEDKCPLAGKYEVYCIEVENRGHKTIYNKGDNYLGGLVVGGDVVNIVIEEDWTFICNVKYSYDTPISFSGVVSHEVIDSSYTILLNEPTDFGFGITPISTIEVEKVEEGFKFVLMLSSERSFTYYLEEVDN